MELNSGKDPWRIWIDGIWGAGEGERGNKKDSVSFRDSGTKIDDFPTWEWKILDVAEGCWTDSTNRRLSGGVAKSSESSGESLVLNRWADLLTLLTASLNTSSTECNYFQLPLFILPSTPPPLPPPPPLQFRLLLSVHHGILSALLPSSSLASDASGILSDTVGFSSIDHGSTGLYFWIPGMDLFCFFFRSFDLSFFFFFFLNPSSCFFPLGKCF